MERKHCSDLDTQRCRTTAANERCLSVIKELQFARVLAKYMEQAKGELEVELAKKD